MYSIAYDEERRLVIATLGGFWSPDMVAAYSADLSALMHRIARQHPMFHMLADAQEMAIQSPEVTQAFGRFTVELSGHCPGRVAILAGTMLNKIQASRALAQERLRVFLDEPAALEWLLAVETA